uniref:Iron-sulfur cluster assembly 2 homolog, mitochondrial n=1 Tax=Ciona savignyi TaxID=51511 RepID=H2Z6Q0_CIOSA
MSRGIICRRILSQCVHIRNPKFLPRTVVKQTSMVPLSTSTNLTNQEELHITDRCVEQLKKVSSGVEFLRVSVEGGGCSGFTYKFDLDTEVSEDDRVYEKNGVKVVTDEGSLELIKGSSIDYEDELIKSSFRVASNPQSDTSCSCGVSFSVQI